MKMSFKVVLWGGIAVVLAVVTVVVFTPAAVWKPPTTTIAHPLHARAGTRPDAVLLERLQLLPHAVRPRRRQRDGAGVSRAATTPTTSR